jgi:hypothetical protein
MIGVFVTFRYGNDFNEAAVRKIAENSRARFAGMPGRDGRIAGLSRVLGGQAAGCGASGSPRPRFRGLSAKSVVP